MNQPNIGDFLSETLVTDTRVYVVTATTAKTITVAPTRTTDRVLSTDGAPYPIVRREEEVDPDAATRTLRLRKDGTYRTADWSKPLHPAHMIDGKPVSKTDYSF